MGKYREGKSFAANNFIRYLQHVSKNQNGAEDWLVGTVPVDCFEFRSDTEGVTSGIWICPEIPVVRTADGEECAVIVMDTQGIDDPDVDQNENVLVFGLPLLLSSTIVGRNSF